MKKPRIGSDKLKKFSNLLGKDSLYIVVILLIAFFSLSSLFHAGFYDSHDGEAHVARFAAYITAFKDGQVPPRWAGDLNYNYGTPLFIFYYPLPGYIASFIYTLGVNLEDTFKIIMGFSFISAPLLFYFWVKTLFRKEIAVIGSLFYGLAPYHFLNLYVRGDVAENLAFTFVPLIFLFLEKLIQKFSLQHLFWGAIAYGLLILSHNGISLMFSPVFLFYIFLRSNNKLRATKAISLIVLGLIISAFFWLPALYEAKYTNADLFIGDMYKEHFPTLTQLVSSNWGFGPDVKKADGLSPQIGILYLLMVVGSIYVAIKNKKERKNIVGWLVVFFLAVFITLPISSFVWEKLPLIKKFEFPWRFTGLSSFAASILACYVLTQIKQKKIILAIVCILLISSIPFVKVKQYISHNDKYYSSFKGTTYFHGEASPIWMAGDPAEFAKSPVEIIGGKGIVKDLERKSQLHAYTVDARNAVTILDNTAYFPGWRVFVDGKNIPIQFQDPNYRGLITFKVPQGQHTIKVVFGETKVRLIADAVSLIGLVFIICILIFFNYKKLGKLKALLYNRRATVNKKLYERKNNKITK